MPGAKSDAERTGVYIDFFHGRKDPGEELGDWGEEGPVLGPFDYAHLTYCQEINLNDDGASLKIVDGMVYYGGMYYGDFSVVSAQSFSESEELRRRHEPFDQAKTFPGGGK